MPAQATGVWWNQKKSQIHPRYLSLMPTARGDLRISPPIGVASSERCACMLSKVPEASLAGMGC